MAMLGESVRAIISTALVADTEGNDARHGNLTRATGGAKLGQLASRLPTKLRHPESNALNKSKRRTP